MKLFPRHTYGSHPNVYGTSTPCPQTRAQSTTQAQTTELDQLKLSQTERRRQLREQQEVITHALIKNQDEMINSIQVWVSDVYIYLYIVHTGLFAPSVGADSNWLQLSKYTGQVYTWLPLRYIYIYICTATLTHIFPVHIPVLQLDETSNLVGTSRDIAGMFFHMPPLLAHCRRMLLHAPLRRASPSSALTFHTPCSVLNVVLCSSGTARCIYTTNILISI